MRALSELAAGGALACPIRQLLRLEDCMQALEGFAGRKVTGRWVLDLSGAAA